ncbi:MAG: glycosyltransferase family 4 protein [Candidatus Paceibacterota bacterium]
MKFVIATGVYPPQVGGPAKYAAMLTHTAHEKGHHARVATFTLERKLPSGIRHFYFFLKMCFKLIGTKGVIALDTMSVGLPSLLAAKVMRKKIIVRVGGDFLWEAWVERIKQMVHLSDFYSVKREFTFKEKAIRFFTKMLYKRADVVAFTTEWQRDFTVPAYNIDHERFTVIENYFGEKIPVTSEPEAKKTFLAVGRNIALKNIERVEHAFTDVAQTKGGIELVTGTFTPDVLEKKIASCGVIVVASFSEVAPNIVLEGLRYNKPFILTQDCGLYEELKDVGVFIDPFDTDSLAEAMRSLSYPAYYESYVAKAGGFKKVREWDMVLSEYLSLL